MTENKSSKIYNAKEIVFREGEGAHKIYFVESGKVKVYKMNEDGKEYITKWVANAYTILSRYLYTDSPDSE